MEQKLTHSDTLVLQDVLKIDGDLQLLPEQPPLPLEEARALATAGVIDPKDSFIYKGVYEVIQLTDRYNSERYRSDVEPAWVAELPMSARTWMRCQYALREEDILANVPLLPHTGLSYQVLEGGLCEEVYREFKLWRLQYIKQLGFLNEPLVIDSSLRKPLSDGTRLLHSYDAMAIGTMIGYNVGLDQQEMHNLRTLLLVHDSAMPAGGDSIKLVAPDELDEDQNFKHVLSQANLTKLEKDFGVRTEVLLSGIHNKGMLGEILDIADKLAYVARDLHNCMPHLTGDAEDNQLGLRTLKHLIGRFPYVCSIWDDVEIQDGHPVFVSIPRLVAFLKVRTLLFRELYYHPHARFGEFLMSRLFVRDLWERGIVNRDMLLEMRDDDLLMLLNKEYGTDMVIDTCSSELARCNTFATVEEARTFVEALKRKGLVFWMLDDNRRAIKTGTNLFVRTPHGPKSLAEADRGAARELEEMARSLPLVHVYWLDGDPVLSQETLAKLKERVRT